MTEYAERHNIARLIGSPPGYVGYGEGGQLTEAVRRHPYSVVLFDEVEKAHHEIFNTMLQIFDDGHLTDGSGRRVDFRNTIIILTSNVGSRSAFERATPIGYNKIAQDNHTEYSKALEKVFAPEFLNRIDEIICFRSLSIDEVEQIVEIEIGYIFARAREQGYEVEISTEAKRRLATLGYESRYGIRSLRRTLIRSIEEPLASLIIDGRLTSGGRVAIDEGSDEGITLSVA
jgi:ATP-dependent Clp protease ATP-binding subunit ClpC